jgi:hypothetical protein
MTAEPGEELLFAADHPVHFEDPGIPARVIDPIEQGFRAFHEEDAEVLPDIGDHAAGEVEPALMDKAAQLLLKEGDGRPKMEKTEFLNLRNADLVTRFLVLLAVAGNGFRRGATVEDRTGGKEVLGELIDVDLRDFGKPIEELLVLGRRGG